MRRIVETIGQHPFATGLLAIVGLVGFGISIDGYQRDREEAQNTADQISSIEERLSQDVSYCEALWQRAANAPESAGKANLLMTFIVDCQNSERLNQARREWLVRMDYDSSFRGESVPFEPNLKDPIFINENGDFCQNMRSLMTWFGDSQEPATHAICIDRAGKQSVDAARNGFGQ